MVGGVFSNPLTVASAKRNSAQRVRIGTVSPVCISVSVVADPEPRFPTIDSEPRLPGLFQNRCPLRPDQKPPGQLKRALATVAHPITVPQNIRRYTESNGLRGG